MDLIKKYNANPFPLQLRLVKAINWQSDPSTYDTPLSGEHHAQFQADAAKDPRLLANGDYDTAGWWLHQKQNGLPTTPSTSTEHFSDTWKKPNHITFSTHSQYSAGTQPDGTPKVNPNQPSVPLQHTGGEWSMHPGQDHLPENQRTWNFTPHPSQVQSPEQHQRLTQYFEREEMPHGHTVTINGQVHQPGMQKGVLRDALDRLKGKAPEPLQPVEDAPSEPKLEQRTAPVGFGEEIKGVAEKFLQRPMTRADANRTVAQGAAVAGVNPGGTVAKIAGAAAPMVQPIAQAASGDIAGAAKAAIKNIPYKQWLAKLATSVIGASQAEFEAAGKTDHSYEPVPDPAKIIARPKLPHESDRQAFDRAVHEVQQHIKQKIGWGGGKMATKGIIAGLLTGGANGEGDISDQQAAIAMHGLGPLHDNGGAWLRHATPQQIAALTGISLDEALKPSWSYGQEWKDELPKILTRWMGTGTSVDQKYWKDYLRSTISLGDEVAKHLKIDPNSPQFQQILTRANLERLCVEFGMPIRFNRGGYHDDSEFGKIHDSPIIHKFLQDLVTKNPKKFPRMYSDLTIEERKDLLKLLPALSFGGSFGTAEQYSPESKEEFDKHLQETKQNIEKELENPQTHKEIETIKEKHKKEAERVQKKVDDEYNRQQERQKARERQKKRHQADARGWGLWDRQRALADTIRPSGQQRLERSLMRRKINRLRKAISQQFLQRREPDLDDPSQATPPSNMFLDEQGRTVAHRLHDAYTSLPKNPSKVSLTVPGTPVNAHGRGAGWAEQRRRMEVDPSTKPINLRNHPGQNLEDMLHNDAVVAMHHRMMGANADYAQAHANGSPESLPLDTGIGRNTIRDRMFEPLHRLYNELQGMARYANSQKLSDMFPWEHRDEEGRLWSSTPGHGREFGNRALYHGTIRNWEGPIDPAQSTLGPAFEGGAGFYGSSNIADPKEHDHWYSARMYATNKATKEEGPVKKYQLAKVGPGQLQLWDISNFKDRSIGRSLGEGDKFRASMPLNKRQQLLGWFTDMAEKYNEPGFVPNNLKNSVRGWDGNIGPYTHGHYLRDIRDLANRIHDADNQEKNSGTDWNIAKGRKSQLHTHLSTMGLIAAGYDGTVNRRQTRYSSIVESSRAKKNPAAERDLKILQKEMWDLLWQRDKIANEDLEKLQREYEEDPDKIHEKTPFDLRGPEDLITLVHKFPSERLKAIEEKRKENQRKRHKLEGLSGAALASWQYESMTPDEAGRLSTQQNISEAKTRSRPITDEEISQGIRPDFWPNGKNKRGHVYESGQGPLNEFYSLFPVAWNKAKEDSVLNLGRKKDSQLARSLLNNKINQLRKAISQQPGMNAKQPGLDDPSQATPPSNMFLDEQGRTVAHRLHDAYTSLPKNPSTVRLDVPGGPNVGGHWLEQRVRMETNPSEKPVNLANHPGQNLQDMLHHDVVVAMHHRLLRSNADYAHAHANGSPESLPLDTGIGRNSIRDRMFEPLHRLYNELQGMARYSGSEKLSKMFPWQHRDEQGRVWSSTPGHGREFGNRVMYHGTLRDWEGPIDPSLSTLGPTHEGGAGFYGSSRTDDSNSPDSWYSARHYTENDTTGEDGPLKKYQLGRIGPGQLKLWDMTNVRERDYPDRNSSPQYRKGMPRKEREHLLGWFTDMAQRYNQPNFVPKNLKDSLMYSNEKHNSKYSHDKYINDIKDLANVSHDMQTQMANMLSTHGRGPATQAALSRYAQLESHLMSMGLTAAGYDGTVNRRPPSKLGAILASPQGAALMRQQRELREQELQAREDALKKLQERAQNNSSLPQDLRGQMRYVLSNPNTEQRDLRDKLEDNQAEFSRLERNMAARLSNMNVPQLGQSAAKQNIIEARQRGRPITDEEIAQGIRPDFWPNGKNERGHVYSAGYGPLNEFYSLLPVSWNKARELPAS